MNWDNVATIVVSVAVSLGGGGAIVLGFANWIGRILANKYVEKLKHEIQQDLESHKTRLKKSELLFRKEFEAASAFIPVHLQLLPRYRIPDMEWDEACKDFAQNFEHVEKMLEAYMAAHGAALQQETLRRLASAKMRASWGKLEVTNGNVSREAAKYAEEVMEALDEIEKELYRAVWSQSGT